MRNLTKFAQVNALFFFTHAIPPCMRSVFKPWKCEMYVTADYDWGLHVTIAATGCHGNQKKGENPYLAYWITVHVQCMAITSSNPVHLRDIIDMH